MHGEEPKKALKDKDTTQDDMYGKYDKCSRTRGVVISEINDWRVQFATQLLACKILSKCKKDECLLGIIVAIEQCLGGVQLA
jgi:hypothetical protein